eukprot:CCRYP_010039-RA/>CCRYP_010039-RA protein AED:0.25 eAED:0.25 QI:0/0/0/1/0/0/2/0/149
MEDGVISAIPDDDDQCPKTIHLYDLIHDFTPPLIDASDSQPFHLSNHVWVHCNATRMLPYQHHGIFLRAENYRLTIADFTATNSGALALSGSIGSFRTYRVSNLVDGGQHNSVTVAATGVVSSAFLGPITILAMVRVVESYLAFAVKEH